MFITFQFPFVDLRRFRKNGAVLDPPYWPLPRTGDFVRSSGRTAPRPLGGIGGWIGEPMFCDASRAMRYDAHPSYEIDERRNSRTTEWRSPPKQRLFHVPFRRLYFDGLAVGKFEVGMATGTPLDAYNRLQNDEVLDVLRQAFSTKVRIPTSRPSGRSFSIVALSRAAAQLAQFYASATAPQLSDEDLIGTDTLAGEALVFVQLDPNEVDSSLSWCRLAAPPIDMHGLDDTWITRQMIEAEGVMHRVWMLEGWVQPSGFRRSDNRSFSQAKDHVRALRIAILRLHAEKQALRLVQRAIISGHLQVEPRTPESDRLQLYLNRAVSRIRGKEFRVADLLDKERAIEWVRSLENRLTAGEGDELLNNLEILELRLKDLDFRPAVLRNVLRYEREATIVMGDQYVNNGQAGSMGPGSYGVAVDQSQRVFEFWEEIDERDQWPEIQNAIRTFTPVLQSKALDDEQLQSLRNFLKAAEAAEEKDGQRLFYYLKRAGAWVNKVASEAGAEVMTKLLLRVAGMAD